MHVLFAHSGWDWIFSYEIISSQLAVNASIATKFSENIIVMFAIFGVMTKPSSNSYPLFDCGLI